MKFLPIEEIPFFHEASYIAHTFVINGVEYQIIGMPVHVEERNIRVNWAPELIQDLRAFHNIDAEAELTRILGDEIAAITNRAPVRGSEFINPGYIYAPYIPMLAETPLINENALQPRHNIMTRYAQRAVDPDNFQILKIASAYHPDGIRFKLTPAVTSDGLEFFEVDKMPLPRINSPKAKLRQDILKKWLASGMLNDFIIEELP